MEVGGAQALRNPPFTPGTPKKFLGTPDNSGTQEKLMGTPGTPAGTPEIFLALLALQVLRALQKSSWTLQALR